MSRFNEETWEGFVCSRKPTQVVCDLHKELPNVPILHCDMRSCRYNAITESNTDPIPIFSPTDEFRQPEPYKLSDYMWLDLGAVTNLLNQYTYDGPRWYTKAECQVMLEIGVCAWGDFKLAFEATAHRAASSLAHKLKSIRQIWEAVCRKQSGCKRMVQQQERQPRALSKDGSAWASWELGSNQ